MSWVAGLARVARLAWVAGLAWIPRLARITRLAWVARLARITRLAGVARLVGITRLAWIARLRCKTGLAGGIASRGRLWVRLIWHLRRIARDVLANWRRPIDGPHGVVRPVLRCVPRVTLLRRVGAPTSTRIAHGFWLCGTARRHNIATTPTSPRSLTGVFN